MYHLRTATLAAVAILLMQAQAWAHPGLGVPAGIASGFMHPLSGLDHVVAMVLVGLWAAMLGGAALWLLPLIFPLVMVVGGAVGMAGLPLPSVEVMIALSAVALGLFVALAIRAPLWLATTAVALFALFHGYAHGQELPEAAGAVAYAGGFVAATATLHAFGLGAGLVTRTGTGRTALRTAGLAMAVLGVFFLQSALSS